MAKLSIRIDFAGDQRLGPGKIALLEGIGALGSISAAGRAMGMSYRRAWLLVAELNGLFREPLVSAQMGGRRGGGAALTRLGTDVVRQYRALEADVAGMAGGRIRVVEKMLAECASSTGGAPKAGKARKKREAPAGASLAGVSLGSAKARVRPGSRPRSRSGPDR